MTGKKHVMGSDLQKVDAHIIQPQEYEQIPELTDEQMATADLYHDNKLVQRGRPKSDVPNS